MHHYNLVEATRGAYMLLRLSLIFLLVPMSLCAMEQSHSPKILSPDSKIISPGKLVYTNPDFDATTQSYLTPSKKSKLSPLSPAKRPLKFLSAPERDPKAVQLKRNLFELSNKLHGNQSASCQPHMISLQGCDRELMNDYYYSLKAESLLNGLAKAIEDYQLSKTLHYTRELNDMVKALENEKEYSKRSDLKDYLLRGMNKRLADEPGNDAFAVDRASSIVESEISQQHKLPVELPEENFNSEDKD